MITVCHSSRFIEMFSICQKSSLSRIASTWDKGQAFKKESLVDNGTTQCIHYGELFTKYGPIIDRVLSTTNEEAIKASKKGDILFPASDVTPNGLARCSAVMLDKILLGGDIIVLRLNDGVVPEFISFAINMQKEQLIRRVTGSVVRHLSAKNLASVIIPVPSLEDQVAFVKIIRQADKSKFISFKSRFFSQFGELPFDHKWKDVLTIINGKAYGEEYKDSGPYPICGSGGIMGYGEKKMCDRNTIILGRKGNIDKPIYMTEDYWIVDTAFCLCANTELVHPLYLYYWCKQFDFQKLNKQAVLPSLTRSDLEQIDIQVPEMTEQLAFVEIVRQADKSKYLN